MSGPGGRARAARVGTIALVWFGGIAAGFVAILAAAARFGCADGDDGLACRPSGSVLGIVVLAAVIAIVTAATLLTAAQPVRRTLVVGGTGFLALVVCFVLAEALLETA